ncbi:Arylsulfatase [Pontiella desulfatans]|uniref:Arylsulfatase n=2 Tax=Pontiella desulfatans TaxID=2750659 RepID=A0A6C2UEX9_PONDE|nr:sulfatase S1_14 [Kiritimatiellales bacterium]VGO17766.1 Arylsulfatase [Pontiella desulfatans]
MKGVLGWVVLVSGLRLVAEAGEIRAMTFNVRYPAPQDLNEKSWDLRKDLVIASIKKHRPDFLGTQEIVAEYLPFLEKELPEYAHIGRFRKGDGDRFDECSKIFYRKDCWEIVGNDHGSFQLSDTPEVVGSRDWTSMARVTSWARFRRMGTGETLYVFNTHWDHRTGRDESSRLCAERIAARKAPDDPVIFMGDFNRYQETNPMRHLLGEKVYGTEPPIAMADTDPGVQKIDHVLVWPKSAKVIKAGVVKDRYDAGAHKHVRPSDHDPTLAIIDFQARRPNVVLILADDLGYGDLSCYGQQNHQTPAIDRLAAEGVRATDFYVPVPYCAPSRAALLTGRHPFRNGLTRNPHPGIHDDRGLRPEEITLAEVFRQAGYATTCIGKWHLGHTAAFHPTQQGFDEYYGILYSNDMLPVQVWENHKVVENPAEQTLLTQRYTERATDFIERNSDKPFFLYLPHAMPHKPLAASAQFHTPETPDDLYADVIRELDGSVATIRQALESAGVLEQTILIFLSDNGPHYGGSTGGLKGKKATSWEGGIRVPFLLRYPGAFPAGQVVSTPLSSLDLFPTLLGLTGVPMPAGLKIDGENITEVLQGTTDTHGPIFSAHNEEIMTIRKGGWKLFVQEPRYLSKRDLNPDYVDRVWPNGITILGQREQPTSMQYPGVPPMPLGNPRPLFNLAADSSEMTDVSGAHPEIVEQLTAECQRFLASMPGYTNTNGEASPDKGQP